MLIEVVFDAVEWAYLSLSQQQSRVQSNKAIDDNLSLMTGM